MILNGHPRVLLPIDEHMIADAAVHVIDHRAFRHRPVGGDPKIGEQENCVAIFRRDGIVLRFDQKDPGESAIDLLSGQTVWMRVKPVS